MLWSSGCFEIVEVQGCGGISQQQQKQVWSYGGGAPPLQQQQLLQQSFQQQSGAGWGIPQQQQCQSAAGFSPLPALAHNSPPR